MRYFFKTSSNPIDLTYPFVEELPNFPTTQFTFSAWLKFIPDPTSATHPSQMYIFSYTASNSVGEGRSTITISNLTNLTIEHNKVKQDSNINISNGNWYHLAVAFTFPPSAHAQAQIYIDGNLHQTLTLAPAARATSSTKAQITVGGSYFPPLRPAFNGLITQVQLWNIAQTASQIQANFLLPTPLNKKGLYFYWPLHTSQDIVSNPSGGDTVIDRSGNNINGTLNNKPTWHPSPWYNLSKWKLSNHNLRGADFSYATLNQTDFKGSNFTEADLSFATLTNPNLNKATFNQTKMNGTTFIKSDLSQTLFNTQPAFSNAPLAPTHFIESTLPFNTIGPNWSYLTLKHVSIQNLPQQISNLNAIDANLTGLDFSGRTLINPNFAGADLTNVNFTNATLINANFNQASLTNANFTNTHITGAQFTNINLTFVTFSTPPTFSPDPKTPTSFANSYLNYSLILKNWVNFDLSNATIRNLPQELVNLNAQGANLPNFTFTNHTLKQAIFDNATLTNADFTQADLSQSSFTGAILTNANLSNTNLTQANFSGAQLGAKVTQFQLATTFKTDLNNGRISPALKQAFTNHQITLSANATVTTRIPNINWLIQDGNHQFDITNNGQNLQVSSYLSTSKAAVLANAYMPDAVFTNANLYAVNMANAQWYGANAKADNADLELTDLTFANLGSMDFTQAKMYGIILDHATLVNTNLNGAYLTPSLTQRQSSFVSANLQGANLAQAQLGDTLLNNAAIALDNGVPFFTINISNKPNIINTLNQNELPPILKTQFTNNGYPLARDSSVQPITPGSQWQITNGKSKDLPQLGTRYATFAIVVEGNNLQIYGSSLWIVRLDANNQTQAVRLNFNATVLQNKSLNSNTILPNGYRYKTYPNNGLTWQQMLTPNQPPHPPACVPTPTHWCTPITTPNTPIETQDFASL